MKKKVAGSIIIGGLILIGLLAYFFYPDWQAQKVAKAYVLNWSSGHSAQAFEATLKPLATDDFNTQQVKTESEAYQKRIDQGAKETNHIQRIFLVDKRPSALQAVVFYDEKNENEKEGYANPMQANLVLYRSGDDWKIQAAYIMQRSDQPIPGSAQAVERVQAQRAVAFQGLIKEWMNTRNTGDKTKFLSFYSGDASKDTYTQAFDKEQKAIHDDKLDFHVETTGVLVSSSTDRQARLLVLTDEAINGKHQMVPLILDMTYAKGTWTIQNVYRDSTKG